MREGGKESGFTYIFSAMGGAADPLAAGHSIWLTEDQLAHHKKVQEQMRACGLLEPSLQDILKASLGNDDSEALVILKENGAEIDMSFPLVTHIDRDTAGRISRDRLMALLLTLTMRDAAQISMTLSDMCGSLWLRATAHILWTIAIDGTSRIA